MNRKKISIAAGSIAIALLIWFFWPPNDMELIKKGFDRLAEAISKDHSHGAYDLLNKEEDIESLLAEDVRIEVGRPMRVINNRQQLIGMYHIGFFQISSLTVSFHDIHITLSPEADKAKAHCTVTVRSPDMGDAIDAREIIVNWVKIEGIWIIKEAHDIPTLR